MTIIYNRFSILIILSFFLFSCGKQEKKYQRESFDLIPVEQGEKWGFINDKGELKINPQFSYARIFCDNLSAVKNKENKWGFIDSTGLYKINPIYVSATDFSEGLAIVARENGKPEIIDTSGMVITVVNDAILVSSFKNGLAYYKSEKNEKFGFIDKQGNVKISPQFLSVQDFSEGKAVIESVVNKKDTLYGFIDTKGKVIINPQFDWCGSFSEGLAMFRSDDKFGFINEKGKIIINPQFDDAYSFSNGFSAVKLGEQWGYINKLGKIAINPQFDEVRNFVNQKACVKLAEEKWGYIDTTGRYVINPQFYVAGSFNNPNLALIKSGDSFGFIDSSGLYVINPQYEYSYLTGWDDFLFDYSSNNSINSQYIDFEKLYEVLFEKDLSWFSCMKKYSSIGGLRKDYESISKITIENNVANVELDKSIALINGMSFKFLSFGFDSDLRIRERYLVERGYYYNYYDYRYVDNNSAKFKGAELTIDLGYSNAYDRQEEIAKKMAKHIGSKKGIKFKDELEDGNNGWKHYVLETDDSKILVGYNNSNMIGVTFIDY